MEKLETFEQLLFDEGYLLKDHHANAPYKAFSLRDYQLISINTANVRTRSDRFCSLMHEYKHFELSQFYYIKDYCPAMVDIQERRVTLAVIRELVPMATLINLIQGEGLEAWEIALRLDVTQEVVQKAYEHYSSLETWISYCTVL